MNGATPSPVFPSRRLNILPPPVVAGLSAPPGPRRPASCPPAAPRGRIILGPAGASPAVPRCVVREAPFVACSFVIPSLPTSNACPRPDLNLRGRVVPCGAAAALQAARPPHPPTFLLCFPPRHLMALRANQRRRIESPPLPPFPSLAPAEKRPIGIARHLPHCFHYPLCSLHTCHAACTTAPHPCNDPGGTVGSRQSGGSGCERGRWRIYRKRKRERNKQRERKKKQK